MIVIEMITQPSEKLAVIKDLFKEYSSELNENLCFQSFDAELEDPLKKYGKPKGCLLLAFYNTEPAGCIALQALQEEKVCEMKRLYVRPQFREHGIGEKLIETLIRQATEIGYKKMVLDTLVKLQSAQRLYTKHCFVNTSAYYANPLSGVVYMQRTLE